ncbi:hypothetical protein [Burkholderia cenocepacia]|uniref:hypothetical protein n=1 Tax=Burkholderia cenocepacia TaxID=95486 RepID=UPI0012375F57|nr:hypothetical protein [Burkholderia cenocepacia]
MKPNSALEAARASLRERRADWCRRYAELQALMQNKIAEDPNAQFHLDADARHAINQHGEVTNNLIAYAAEIVEQFDASPGSKIFHFLIEHDPILASALGASPVQLAIKSGTLRRDVQVTTEDGRKLQWTGLFLTSGQFVGLENHDAEELRSPHQLELERQGYMLVDLGEVQLIKDGELIDGIRTADGIFFPIDGPLAFLNQHRADDI